MGQAGPHPGNENRPRLDSVAGRTGRPVALSSEGPYVADRVADLTPRQRALIAALIAAEKAAQAKRKAA